MRHRKIVNPSKRERSGEDKEDGEQVVELSTFGGTSNFNRRTGPTVTSSIYRLRTCFQPKLDKRKRKRRLFERSLPQEMCSMTNKQTQEEPGMAEEDTQIDKLIQRRIGAKLRSYYDELLNEPIPEKFIELLVKLDEKERKEGKS
jgi:hypothetical protein